MEDFFGTLSINDSTSVLSPSDPTSFPAGANLVTEDTVLLLAGFKDVNQAMSAATDFIRNQKQIASGTPVGVTGAQATVGQQPVIVMQDINAVSETERTAARIVPIEKGGGERSSE